MTNGSKFQADAFGVDCGQSAWEVQLRNKLTF